MKKEQKKELHIIQKEVESYYSKLEISTNEKFGCKIFYSNLSKQTDILFIGINPGTGYDNYDKDISLMDDGLQYFKEEWVNNNLAKDTLTVFEKAGYLDKLKELNNENKIVKTNLYYLLTKESITLDNYIQLFGLEFKEKHIDWTNRIINLCNPKLIIYEGKYLNKDCPPSIESVIQTENIGNTTRFVFKNNITGLMYSRSFPMSGIKNKEEFASVLKTELDKIYK